MVFNLPQSKLKTTGKSRLGGQHAPEWHVLMVKMPFWHI
jgi:hypothetical protein